jgi:hypothetical protein
MLSSRKYAPRAARFSAPNAATIKPTTGETHNAAKLNDADGVGINPDIAIPRQITNDIHVPSFLLVGTGTLRTGGCSNGTNDECALWNGRVRFAAAERYRARTASAAPSWGRFFVSFLE